MAVIRQGGGPNPPVQLDPVQQIVNVHWPREAPDTPRYVTFSVGMNRIRTDYDGHPITCSPVEEEIDEVAYPGPGISMAALRYFAFTSSYPVGDDKTMRKAVWSGEDSTDGESGEDGAWATFFDDEFTVAGMPDSTGDFDIITQIDYAQWVATSTSGDALPDAGSHGWDLAAPPPSGGIGDEPETELPGSPSSFEHPTSPVYRMRLLLYRDAPKCYWDSLGRSVYGGPADPAEVMSETLDVTALDVTYGGVNYTPIATTLIRVDGHEPLHRGVLWVLCERTEETS